MKRANPKPSRPQSAKQRGPSRAHRDAGGRVHLALHRDPASGRAQVTLVREIFGETWQNQVAVATASTAYATLGDQPSVAKSVELSRSVMASTSRLCEGFLARAPQGSVACKAGCDHCCYQAVGVTPPEALAIADHLRNTLSKAELAAVTERIVALHEKTRALSAAERFSPDHPCAFLENGRCTVYEVRPLSCRGMNSLDADECASRLREPAARAEFLEQGFGGHTYMEPIRAFHAVSAGLQLALGELFELDMRPLDLIAAIRLLLEGKSSVARDWIAGHAAFRAALGGDATGDLGLRDLAGAGAPGDADG